MKYLKYTREILLTVAGIVIILLLFAKPCNRNRSGDVKALAIKTDSLERELKLRDERYAVSQKEFSQDTADARREAQSAVNDVKAVRKQLLISQQIIYRLAERLDRSKSDTSSSFVKVGPSFVEDCDSIKLVALNQQTQIDDYNEEAGEAEKLLKYETKLRDDQIAREKKYSDSLKQAIEVQRAIAREAINLAKPKGKLLAGAGVIGNQTTFLSGAKIALAYQTKGGKQYQGGAILMGGTVYYEAGVLIQLFK